MARRSLLFSPGDRPEMMRKAADAGADVLAFDLGGGFLVCGFQRFSGKGFYVESARVGSLMAVGDVVPIGIAGEQWLHAGVDNSRFDEGAVGSDSHDDVGTILSSGLVVPAEYVLLGASHHVNCGQGLGECGDYMVGRQLTRGNYDAIYVFASGESLALALEHGGALEIHHHFAGKACGAHSRLDDHHDMGLGHAEISFMQCCIRSIASLAF
jgi:hypothetical protein